MENNLGKKIIGKPSTPQKVAEAFFFFLNWSLRHPNPEWCPFWALFFVGMGSCGRSEGSKFRRGNQISIPFLGLGLLLL